MIQEKAHNLIYKTTDLLNNKIYIGVHKTDNINDGYLGSGVDFNKHLKKIGKKNFKREILFNFKTYEEALNKEKEIVNKDFLKRKDVYNLSVGGNGGFPLWLSNSGVYVDEFGNKKILKTNNPNVKNGKFKHINSDTIFINDGIKNRRISKNSQIPYGWKLGITEETRKNRKSGILNKLKINNGKINRYIDPNSKIPKGWKKGSLKSSTKNTIWINNGKQNKCHNIDLPIPKGFLKGQIKTDKIYIHNNFECKKISKSEKIPKGWIKGLLRKNKQELIQINNGLETRKVKNGTRLPKGFRKGSNLISITDGINNKFIQENLEIPSNWFKGMTKRKGVLK